MSRPILISWIIIIVAIGVSTYGCEDCDDCGPLEKDPSVTLKFINQDSLTATQVIISNVNAEIDSIGLLLQDINATDSSLESFDKLDSIRQVMVDSVAQLGVIKNLIESGKVKIDSLISIMNGTSIDFGPDSLELFKFPLSVNEDATAYEIHIAGGVYDLGLEYSRNFNEDEKSRIEVVVTNINIIDHTFKEAIISCEVCKSNDTSITLSF